MELFFRGLMGKYRGIIWEIMGIVWEIMDHLDKLQRPHCSPSLE